MIPNRDIRIQALVTGPDRSVVAKAAALIRDSLTQASNRSWTIDLGFASSTSVLETSNGPTVLIVSLLEELDRLDEPWTAVEARLWSKFRDLCDAAGGSVFVCTVLRHVHDDGDESVAAARRVRIRRLNLLTAEMSREMGLLVVDIDRDLADVGARALETDYRLGGAYAAAAAAKSMAMSLLLVGLDDFVSIETQDAARRLVGAMPVETRSQSSFKPRMIGRPVVSVNTGKRRQLVEATIDPVDENFIASHIARLLKGHISLGDAVSLLMGSVSRRGWRASSDRLLAGFRRAAGRGLLAKR